MKPAVVRLAVTALLFACWIGYEAYQVATRPRTPAGQPLVVSRPQILVSDFDVIVQVDGLDKPVLVEQVLYAARKEFEGLAGQKIRVTNLAECRGPSRDFRPDAGPPDWTGSGRYLLPLHPVADGKEGQEEVFEVVPTPASPGYPPVSGKVGPPRIYPANDEVLAQYHQVPKPR
jgi:hypothetical protein